MLKQQGFDEWSKKYDDYVQKSDGYPFEGYNELMNKVVTEIHFENKPSVLDVGVGTGTLASLLYSNGARITGVDFSSEMIKIAKSRIQDGVFYAHDLNEGLPKEIKNEQFHYIISTYVFHHFNFAKKVNLIRELTRLLKTGGKILIGDVAFETEVDLNRCKINNNHCWDDDELYIVADHITEALESEGITSNYTQISSCAGILIIEK